MHVQLAAVILIDEQGKVLIHKRPQSGLLANLWEFPNIEIHHPLLIDRKQIIELFKNTYNLNIKLEKIIGQIRTYFFPFDLEYHGLFRGVFPRVPIK